MIFYLLGTNGFHAKVKTERFTAAFLQEFVFTISSNSSDNCPLLPHCPGDMVARMRTLMVTTRSSC